MRKIIIRPFVVIISISILVLSCEPENTSRSELLEGIWKCEEDHAVFGETTYNVEIIADVTETNTIYIYNFLNLGENTNTNINAVATIIGSSITITQQNVGGHIVEGTGNIAANNRTIDLNFTDDDGSGTKDAVSARLTK